MSRTQKFVYQKMAQPNLSNGKFPFFPRWSLWSGGGGGGSKRGPPPPTVYGHSNTSPVPPLPPKPPLWRDGQH